MRPRHLDTDLIPYVSGALAPADGERLSTHLGQCARCAETAEAFGRLLQDLRRSTPRPPGVDPARYGSELRARIERRRRRGPALGLIAGLTAAPLALSAGVVSLLLLLTAQPAPQRPDLLEHGLKHGPILEALDVVGGPVERVTLDETWAPGRRLERVEMLCRPEREVPPAGERR
jgi:anti-sigma factor RsiW